MAILLLTALAAQIGSACYNNYKNKKHAEEMARKQQAFEEKVAREGIENARAEFSELCMLQREMEAEMQRDRLNLIRTNHDDSIHLTAYENSLGTWPLMVPPYVIKNDVIASQDQSGRKAIPLNCILTTSTDNKFNRAIFYKLEEAMACFCSKYWNVSADKSIRFFQEAWRDSFKDVGSKHKDLYSHLSDVPTLVMSPVIKNDKLIFRFYWWGLSPDPADAHLYDTANELNPEVNVSFIAGMDYTEKLVESVLSVCVPKLEAFVSFFADMYYWNYYGIPPLLPSLIINEKRLKENVKEEIVCQYDELLESSMSDKMIFNAHPERIIYLIKSLPHIRDKKNQCLKVWKKRFLKCACKGKTSIEALLDLNLYSKQDAPFLMALVNIFPEYSKELMDLSVSLNEHRFTQVPGISKEQKYNRKTNNLDVTVGKCIDIGKIETPKKLSKYNF